MLVVGYWWWALCGGLLCLTLRSVVEVWRTFKVAGCIELTRAVWQEGGILSLLTYDLHVPDIICIWNNESRKYMICQSIDIHLSRNALGSHGSSASCQFPASIWRIYVYFINIGWADTTKTWFVCRDVVSLSLLVTRKTRMMTSYPLSRI